MGTKHQKYKPIEGEIFKPVVGFESLYEVSNFGRVKSLPKQRGTMWAKNTYILKQKIDRLGYCVLGLSKDNKVKHFTVHRIVAMAFLPNPLNKPEINHIDENKQNNRVENLEWVTSSENKIHSRKRNGSYQKKVNMKMAIEIRKNHVWGSDMVRSCFEKYGIKRSTYHYIISGKWTGFKNL